MTEKGFSKYDKAGAYHWSEASDSLFTMNAFVRGRYDVVVDLLAAERLLPDDAVLDVGCGDGALSGVIYARFGCAIHGVDLEPTAIELARSQFKERGYPGQFAPVDGYDYPFESDMFRAIVMADVIEHVSDPLAMLAEAKRLLAPGGVLIVTTPIRISEETISAEHVQEWFAEQFDTVVEKGFGVAEKRIESHAVVWYEIYDNGYKRGGVWRWGQFLLNCLARWGANVFSGRSSLFRFHMMQTVLARK